MKSEKLKNHVLEIFEEIKHDKQGELQLEGLSGAYSKLAKFLLKQVKAGKFLRNYDIDTNSGRLMFQTGSGKKIVFKWNGISRKLENSIFTWKIALLDSPEP